MIKFKVIRWKNFLSYGNNWTEINIEKFNSTLISGKNGQGKSTFLDTICFSLYGKPLRNIPKPLLISSTNKKNMVCEIEFTTQNNNYVVRRGMKPNIFEIYCNGNLVPPLPSVIEMQDYLEKYILKCNFKAFTQVVILGAASYIPFMQLTPQVRREILEDVLDIEVFSVMHTLLKERVSETKDKLAQANQDCAVIQSQHDLAETYEKQRQQNEQAKKDAIKLDIDNINNDLSIIANNLVNVDIEIKNYAHIQPELDAIQIKLNEVYSNRSLAISEKAKAEKNQKFFSSNAICPTCRQDIDEKIMAKEVHSATESIAGCNQYLKDFELKIKSLEDEAQNLRDKLRILGDLRSTRTSFETQQRMKNAEKDKLTKALNAPIPVQQTIQIGDLTAARKKVDDLIIQKSILDQGNILLKDNGIKTRIINQYLPVINKTINKYLTALNFPVQFMLNEQFQETIKSKGRDEFIYGSFSEGEKRRLDLAIILTWRDIAKLKNSVACNLLIFDEIFDSSLDVDGMEDFMKLLQKMDSATNMFLISHKMDSSMSEKFQNTIAVSKKKGFSILETPK